MGTNDTSKETTSTKVDNDKEEVDNQREVDNTNDNTDNDNDDLNEVEGLGDAGKKAIVENRKSAKEANGRAKDAEEKLNQFLSNLNGLLGGDKKDKVTPEQLEDKLKQSEAKVKKSELEKQVILNKGDADVERLFNHVGFLKELQDVEDVSDKDVISDLIKSYTEKHPYLKSDNTVEKTDENDEKDKPKKKGGIKVGNTKSNDIPKSRAEKLAEARKQAGLG